MKQTRQGDAGAVLSAGSTYTVTEALGAQLVGNGFATDVNGALQPDIDFDVSAKVNGVTGGIEVYAGTTNVFAALSSNSRQKNVGTYIFGMAKGGGGSVASQTIAAVSPSTGVNGVGQYATFGCAIELETEYDWVRFFIVNPDAAIDIKAATATSIADISTSSAAVNNTGFAAPSGFLFNGSATVTLPAGTVNAPSLLFSDKLYLSSVPRTDGGTRPALGMRVAFTSSALGSATVMPYYNRSGSDWSVEGSTKKMWTYAANTNTDLTTGSVAATATRTGNAPFFGVQYGSKRNVVSILWVGDSIVGGASLTNNRSFGFGAKSCYLNSTVDRPIESSILSVPGATIATWATILETAYAGPTGGTTGFAAGSTNLDVLNPSHLMLSSWSVNNAPNTTITTAQINTIRQGAVKIAELAQSRNIEFCHWNGIPRGSSTTYYTVAGDVTQRQAYNADSLGWGYFASNFGAALANQALGSDQGFNPSYSGDGLHPNDAGDAILTIGAGYLVKRIAVSYFGAKVPAAANSQT